MRPGPLRRAALAAVLAGLALPASASAEPCAAPPWIGAWHASPSSTTSGFTDQTLRLVITPHLGGRSARVRLTNRFGDRPVTFGRARIARRAAGGGAALVPGTSAPLTFGGREAVTIPAGEAVLSDPAAIAFEAFDDLAISLAVTGATGPATEHFNASQTSFIGDGDLAAQESGAGFDETTRSWSFLTDVEVEGRPGDRAVVAVGDSITDGFQGDVSPVSENDAGIDRNERYPDHLSRRLLAAPGGSRVTVLNAGISGNRILRDGQIPQFGPRLLSRLDADVLAHPAVTHVIVLEGINDIGQAPAATAPEIIEGLRQAVQRIQAAGKRALVGTLTPAGGTLVPSYGFSSEAPRQEVNRWIRTSGVPDGVVDFDAALRDPADPRRLLPRYDSSDHLHPSSEGYRAMAAAVDLGALGERAACSRAAPAEGTPAPAPRAQGRLRIRVTPRRDRLAPRRFRVRGRLAMPAGAACPRRRAVVALRAGSRTLAVRRPRLGRRCAFTATLAYRPRSAPRRLRIVARVGRTAARPLSVRAR